MRLYLAIDRMAPRLRYGGKFALLAFAGVHIPLLVLLAALFAWPGEPSTLVIFLVVLGGTLAGVGVVLPGLRALLAPVRVATEDLDRYLRDGVVPLSHNGIRPQGDEAARLLRGVAEVCAALEEENRALARLATQDPLTGLLSRRGGEIRLEQAMSEARRNDTPYVAAMLDLDHFKRLNDTQGHNAGDDALRMVGSAVLSRLRAGDWAARWGGEEALIVCRGDEQDACGLFERIRAAIEEETPVTASIGCAVLGPLDTSAGWLGRADEALYEAKRAGRNAIRIGVG